MSCCWLCVKLKTSCTCMDRVPSMTWMWRMCLSPCTRILLSVHACYAVVMLSLPMHEWACNWNMCMSRHLPMILMSVFWTVEAYTCSCSCSAWHRPTALHSMYLYHSIHMRASLACPVSTTLKVALCTKSDHQQYHQSTRQSCSPSNFP